MKSFIVPEMTFKGHSRSSEILSYVRSPLLATRDRKNRVHLFSEKIAEMTLEVEQYHWRWHSSVGYISLCITGL